MTKKTKELEVKSVVMKHAKELSAKEMKEYVAGPGLSTDEVVKDLEENKPFCRKGSEKCWVRRRMVIADLPCDERIEKLASKDNKRGQVCKILCEKGEISREDYKKFNAWGDIRFIREFVTEEIRDGETVYVLKEDLKSNIINVKKV